MKMLTFFRRALATLFTICFVLMSGVAEAVTVVYNDATTRDYVIGISDLEIGNTNYNVDFVFGMFQDVFGDPTQSDFKPPTFWNIESDAIDAANAIAGTLNREIPISFLNPAFEPLAFFVPWVETEYGGFPAVGEINACGGNGTWEGVCGYGVARIDTLASWSVVTVPEPGINILFGVGMVGLAMWRKKKNKAVYALINPELVNS